MPNTEYLFMFVSKMSGKVTAADFKPVPEKEQEDAAPLINQKGKEGWDLSFVSESNFGYLMSFKRPLD